MRYPGVWLAPDVYALHGHYLDRLLPAALRGRLREKDGSARSAVDDFERAPGSDAGGVSDALAAILPDGMGESVEAAVGQARRTLLAGIPALATIPGMREAASLAALVWSRGCTGAPRSPRSTRSPGACACAPAGSSRPHPPPRPASGRPSGSLAATRRRGPAPAQQRLLGLRQRAGGGCREAAAERPVPPRRGRAGRAGTQSARGRSAGRGVRSGAARTGMTSDRRAASLRG